MDTLEESKEQILADLSTGYKQRYIIDDIIKKYGLQYRLYELLLMIGSSAEYKKHLEHFDRRKAYDITVWTDEQVKILCEMYEAGASYIAIETRLGIPTKSIARKLRRMRDAGYAFFPRREQNSRRA